MKIIICILIITILGSIIIWNETSNRNYINGDIFEEIRVIYSYQNVKEKEGKQIEEMQINIEDKMVWVVYYEGMQLIYDYQEKDERVGSFMWAQIDSAIYTFGKQKIGVGMPRESVEKILQNAKRPTPPISECDIVISKDEAQQKMSEDYYDDNYNYGIGIVYDKNDCVEYILVYKGL